jgi:hypothetical protein
MKNDYFGEFVGAMLRAGPTPCERFNCAKQSECASQDLACSAFRLYVHKGNVRQHQKPACAVCRPVQTQRQV